MKLSYFQHLICLLVLSSSVQAQKAYFQQDIRYKIDVKLDDESHILRGYENFEYTNNSSDTLKYLFIHLYPNAYKNDRSAFTEQLVNLGKTDFYFSKEDDRGFIDSLDFKVNQDPVMYSNYNNMEDVILLELNKPLPPNKKIEVSTPFRVVIPAVFSRMGHDQQNYQLTQWYPKPAVYDLNGWHPQPYLDQGEFYGEFANFTVNIEVPSSYIVAATGELQTESEKQFIQQVIDKKNTADKNSSTYKKIQFTQDKVHDFAWFASKDYLIEKKEILLGTKKVACYSYVLPKNETLYDGSTEIIAQTIQYLSAHVGEYPYVQASIVDGKLLAGGGMEYPMITLIGAVHTKSELQTVIIHEVGHNWFYGILANNERDHPWLDESINSMYEDIIDEEINSTNTSKTPEQLRKIEKKLNGSFAFLLSALQHEDQAIENTSEAFTSLNYGGVIYKKASLLLRYVRSYLGEPLFDQCMKKYYETYKFKHPNPADFQQIFEQESGKQLNWFFDQGINTTTPIDFKISSVKKFATNTEVYAHSKTHFKGPIPIYACNANGILATKWIEYPYTLPAVFSNELQANSFYIDKQEVIPETKISNNHYFKHKLFKKTSVKLKLGSSLGIQKSHNLYLLPALGYNYYDKTMLGLSLHNLQIPNLPFQFAFAPMYSFGTKQFTGTGFMAYSIFPKNSLQKVTFSMQGKSYHHQQSNLNIPSPKYLRHIRLAPSIELSLKKPFATSTVDRTLTLQYLHIIEDQFKYIFNTSDSLYRPALDKKSITQIGRIKYLHENNRTFNPFSYQLQVEGNHEFMKIGLTLQSRIDYHIKNKAFYVRAYGGKFIDFQTSTNYFNLRQRYLNTTFHGQSDYAYDETYIARNEQITTLSQQVSMQEGGFKMRTLQYASPIGLNDNWLASINLRSDIPIKSPIKLQVFVDAATFANAKKLNPSGQNAVFEAGLELHLFSDLLVVYAPFILSKDFKDYSKQIYPKNRFLHNMSFALNFSQLNFRKTQDVMNYLK
ncbi:MAG: M1 family metallopeptidase [Chitinophagaceae bacterium]|nr:M1 family metallopeptidase [Chitinophagaceae bacterium]